LPQRLTLFGETNPEEAEFQRLVERLSSRLGESAVLRSHCIPEPQPELAWRFQPWLRASATAIATLNDLPERPCRLFTPSQRVRLECDSVSLRPWRLHWQREEHLLTLVEGPERIVTGWWRSQPVQRDYYRVETERGRRLWLFQDLLRAQWYVQGVFD
jgi:protein ImuB